MSVNSKMTALVNEIRELSGTTTKKSIDAMTADVSAANAEVTNQADLIDQIQHALEGKAGGSGEEVTALYTIINTTDCLLGINGQICFPESTTPIYGTEPAPIIFTGEALLGATFIYEFTESSEGDDGNIIEEEWSPQVMLIDHDFFPLGIGWDYPVTRGTTITIRLEE